MMKTSKLRQRHPRLTLLAAIAVAAVTVSGCTAIAATTTSPAWKDGRVLLPVQDGTASIDPATLQIEYHRANGTDRWSAPARSDLGKPSKPTVTEDAVTWTFNDSETSVVASTVDGRLNIELNSLSDHTLAWPVSAGDDVEAVQFPNGEGLSIPVDDAFWRSEGAGLDGSSWDFAGGLTMPFWGSSFARSGVSYIVQSDIGTTLEFRARDERIEAFAEHTFSAERETTSFGVSFAPTDGNPVAAGQDYRQFLTASNGLVTLDEKIAENPNTASLIGALHAYTWGDGRDIETVERLRALGIERAWLGYDADGDPVAPDVVAAAQDAGYLIGPYDTWDNAQDPATADTESSIWPGDVWPNGCVTDANGQPVLGFGGRGCYVSTAALDAAQSALGALNQRVQSFIQNGAASYFLDVDAVGQLFRDYSPAHPQTEAEDRERRLARMQTLASGGFSNGAPLVLGSETVAAWANPAVSYSHGSSTPLMDGIWELQGDEKVWGAWWPSNRPGRFFDPTALPEQVSIAMFSPAYRVPLYQTVLHDSVISTDRWEMGLFKFPALVRDRTLTNLLYNTPAVIALDTKVLDEHGKELAELQTFFGLLQDAAGTAPLTSFERLEGGVQRTTFGDGVLTITVNFSKTARADVGAGCAVAKIDGTEHEFCTRK